MTLNITVASPRFVICATDRRLINVNTKRIATEQSTKLTLFYCKDAVGLIVYNGIGRIQAKTPSDWILELDQKVNFSAHTIDDIAVFLRDYANAQFRSISQLLDLRHSFIIGALSERLSRIIAVSNYEEANSEKTEAKARSQFAISEAVSTLNHEVRVLATGATNNIFESDFQKLVQVAGKSGATGTDIKNLCVKAIRNAATSKNNKGSIGSSVLWSILERGKGPQSGLDVLGGTTILVSPNIIDGAIKYKDILLETSKTQDKFLLEGKPSPLPENICGNCGNPVPLGYNQCGVCGEKYKSYPTK